VKYTVVYERTARNYSAYVPDLPGCVAAAETKTDTRRLIQEAIKLHIEAMREAGETVPQPGISTELIEV
jgi:predicted RNase H-like HicB family nuclease